MTAGTRSQVSKHRAVGPNSAERTTSSDGEERVEATMEGMLHAVAQRVEQPVSQRKHPVRCNKIKWLKGKTREEWCCLCEHLSKVLEHSLRGPMERKLTLMTNILL